jgi:hypothetical protein
MILPPPMPDWTDLISKVPPAPEVTAIPRQDLPCNACGVGHRVVYESGAIDAYCKECRKKKNHKSYLERKNRDIRIGGIRELRTLGAPGGVPVINRAHAERTDMH